MAEPVMLVTGSTDGIGKVTATELALGGAGVILHGRDEKKGRRVQKELEQKTGTRPDLVIADYSRQDQIRSMAADIASRYTRLDVLVNDAGTYQKARHVTQEGAEFTFAVNYLGPFLLTHLLLPLLGKGSRIVTVASSAHFDVDRIDWDNLPQQRRYDPWGAYSLSKFADVTFTYTLARNLEGPGSPRTASTPGLSIQSSPGQRLPASRRSRRKKGRRPRFILHARRRWPGCRAGISTRNVLPGHRRSRTTAGCRSGSGRWRRS